MEVVVFGSRIDPRRFEDLLNRELNEYNVRVRVVEGGSTRGRQVLKIYPELITPVKYSPLFSQVYDRERIKAYERQGRFVENPRERFGTRMRVLHWYHWAMLNDVVAYIMERLKERGLVEDYYIRSAVGKYRAGWRNTLSLEYVPEEDPAFLKRVVDPITRFRGIPIYVDRMKMLEVLESGRIEKALMNGELRPKELEELENKILDATGAITFFEGIAVPERLQDCRPLYQAWFEHRYGADAEAVYSRMTEEEREREWCELVSWLTRVDPGSGEFARFLKIWKEKIASLILWAAMQYGPFETEQRLRDDAGFPLEMARKLLTEPYRPRRISESDIESLAETRREKEYESATQ